VSGTVITSDEKVLDQVQVNDPSQNLNLDISSGFDIDVEIKSKSDSAKFTIENVKVDQLFVCDKSVSAETLLQNQSVIASNIKLEGQSMIRVTDSRLSLQSIDRVTINLRSKATDRQWDVLYASVECIQAKVSRQTTSTDEPLFSNTEISACHYRSCLLDPLYFNVVNKQIVSIISDCNVSQRLRIRAIQFLAHIVQKDQRIHALVL